MLLPALDASIAHAARAGARRIADVPMLCRTHGQTATPTTLGKEIANVAARLADARERIAARQLLAKMNGAVGNYNAHLAAYPTFDWEAFARRVVEERLGLALQPAHDPDRAARLHRRAVRRGRALQHDPDRLVARRLGLHLPRLLQAEACSAGEVGSSTMPHKVNPIDFENAEGNLGLANALLRAPVAEAADLPLAARPDRHHGAAQHGRRARPRAARATTRWRAAWPSSRSTGRARRRPRRAWEVLAEPVQTVMRRHGMPEPVRAAEGADPRPGDHARGAARLHRTAWRCRPTRRQRLLALTPAAYTGAGGARWRGR